MTQKNTWLVLILAGILSFSCRDEEKNDIIPSKDLISETTVLLYMMGENSLSYFVGEDLQEVEEGVQTLPEKSHFIVFVDDASYPYLIHYENKKGIVACDTLIRYTKEVCSTDTTVLKEVLNTVYDRFPSNRYGLILWSHGDGWIPATTKATTRFIGIDNGTNSHSSNKGVQMDIPDLANVLEEFPAMKFILFDACFMQSVEVAYELRHCTEYLIGSPMEIPGPGAPYDKIMAPMFSQDSIDIHGIAYNYYANYDENLNGGVSSTYGAAISTICCAELENLATKTHSIISNNVKKGECPDVSWLYPYDFRSMPLYHDLGDFIQQAASANEYNEWKEQWRLTVPDCFTTKEVYSAFKGHVLMDTERYHGISMYMPREESRYQSYNTSFQQTSWYSAAGWNETGW